MDDISSRLPSVKPVALDEAYYLVHAKASHYPSFISLYLPNAPYEKLNAGLEPINHIKKHSGSASFTIESDLERSLRRTRKQIKDYVFCNQFDLFVTFTFKDDRQNIDRCKSKMNNWLKNQKKRTGKFNYIIVAEFHKDLQSIHFHALFRGYKGRVEQSINPKTDRPIKQGTRYVYELPSYTLGFTNVKKIDDKQDSLTKVGFYIQKYITKDMPVFANKNRYWASRGLAKPIIEENPPAWYLHLQPDRVYENEHGKILEFDTSKHALASLFHRGVN